MKLIGLISILLLVSTSTFLFGGSENDTHANNTILFKLTKQNSSKISYLFGTHHAFGKVFFDSLTNANQALESCDLLIKENLNIPGEMAEDIINQRSDKTKWKKYLSDEDLSFIINLFAASPTDYNKMTPTEMYVFLNRYFKQQVCLNKTANDTSFSLDDYIGSKARQMNLELVGLETIAEQIELINKDVEGMPRKVHKRRLSNIIAKIQSKNNLNCEETDWYFNMEVDYQLKQPCRNSLMLTDRNEKWMKTIKHLIENHNCFIAVGLSHLMYQCGLINELKALGYKIEPVSLK